MTKLEDSNKKNIVKYKDIESQMVSNTRLESQMVSKLDFKVNFKISCQKYK